MKLIGCFSGYPRGRMFSGGHGWNCVLRSVNWNGFQECFCMYLCVCCVCYVCVSLWTMSAWVWACWREKRVMFTFGACVSANFGCTSFFDPCWGPFTSSWCSFCSTSWSKPGCCLQTALMRKTPEDRHNRDACYSFLKMSPSSCIQELINAVKRC